MTAHNDHTDIEHPEEKTGPGDALKRDWEQTKSDMPGMKGQELDQDVPDTVRQAAGKQ